MSVQEACTSSAASTSSSNIPKYVTPIFCYLLFEPDNFNPPIAEEEHIDLETMITNEVERYYVHVGKQMGEITEQLRKGTFDVLRWWKENSKSFPNIALTVRYILCVPATSVNCERTFSSAKYICTKKNKKIK